MSEIINTNNRYSLYIEKNIELAETIVIKLNDVVNTINESIVYKYGSDSFDLSNKTTWKYYQNISGRYHFSDTIMQIDSLDTDIKIDFTVQNLLIHKSTKAAYSYNSRYYKELVSLYPDQEVLILGILNPVDINYAINSKDGTILSYPKYLVEQNEYTLIEQLQSWIYGYIARWNNKQYCISDDLYVCNFVAQLYLHLFQHLICLRLKACKTNEAHSYHIYQYLSSHGYLDTYLDTLNKKQALFFYRNISYIERNPGKVDTFDWLVENVMTQRNLPLYQLTINHDSTNLNKDNLLPNIVIPREPINSFAKNTILTDFNLEQTLNVIEQVAPSNTIFHNDNLTDIQDNLLLASTPQLPTKTLQCVTVDRSKTAIYIKSQILLNHWIYLSSRNIYTSSIYITLKKDNISLRMTNQQAVGLFTYLSLKVNHPKDYNLEDTAINTIRVNRVSRLDSVSFDELKNITTNKILDNEILEILNSKVIIPNSITSIIDFNLLCNEIFITTNKQFDIYSSKQDMLKRAYALACTERLYCDATIELNELKNNSVSLTYKELLNKINLDLSNYTNEDLLELAQNVLTISTGNIDNIVSMETVQDSMTKLLLQLSSYSIQVVNQINDDAMIIIPNTPIRLGNVKQQDNLRDYLYSRPVNVLKTNTLQSNYTDVSSKSLLGLGLFKSNNKLSKEYKINVKPFKLDKVIDVHLGHNYLPMQVTNLQGIGNYNSLTNEQKYRLIDNQLPL